MIGLVGLRAGRGLDGVQELARLPDPPALRWAAFFVRTSRELGLAELVHLLRAVVAQEVRGGLAYVLEVTDPGGTSLSPRTVRRRLKKADLRPLGELLRDARLWSVHLRTQLGTSRADAVRAAGFNSVKAFENAVRRSG